MGYSVSLLSLEEITWKTRIFDVVITGIRAYNCRNLANKQNMCSTLLKEEKNVGAIQHPDEVKTANIALIQKFRTE
jgi:hypothetical protein